MTDTQPDTPTLLDTIIELAAKDREATINTVLAALEQLGVVRPAVAHMAYDYRIIGAHANAERELAKQIGTFLHQNGVIDFARKTGQMAASVTVILPASAQVGPDDGQEVKN